jgi:hypothetical protein
MSPVARELSDQLILLRTERLDPLGHIERLLLADPDLQQCPLSRRYRRRSGQTMREIDISLPLALDPNQICSRRLARVGIDPKCYFCVVLKYLKSGGS